VTPLSVDEAPEIRGLERPPGKQFPPGEGRVLALLNLIQSVADRDKRGFQIFKRRFFEPNAFERLGDCAENPAQTWIKGERA
jgi:hypothetical protein